MYGATCCGIRCEYAREAIEEAARRGLTGSLNDSLGLSAIVYWKRITGKPEDPAIELLIKDEEDYEEEHEDDEEDGF